MRAPPRLLAAVPCLLVALAGCSGGGSGDPRVAADLVTPGTWHVGGSPDYTMAWVRNLSGQEVEYRWELTGAGGAPLPEGWAVTFGSPTGVLDPRGQKVLGARGYTYPDWGHTRIQLTLPGDAAGQTVPAQLRVAGVVTPVDIVVAGERQRVSQPGDRVTVDFDGRFADTGERFWQGELPATLGSRQLVVGVDEGLLGAAQGENVTLIVPPAFAYGYDNRAGSGYEQFNGKTLQFDVRILGFT